MQLGGIVARCQGPLIQTWMGEGGTFFANNLKLDKRKLPR